MVAWFRDCTSRYKYEKGHATNMKDIREDEAWWSPVRYTVDDFRFEEEGAVLGDANEFINHSRL